ncbi:uncharacterized protein LOC131884607 isoform X1 [Tigriopus californicus]|uniref:uncharacterized protein LOC131884607 isoform X1 n=1 Tax=Tigriopus californicus TaxID=6832 RepID=UPI0027DA72B4|nr:uncharacterized protein LOC131884607 isoform X1 [Tigriopus californicus]|eukprot:TCALIF_11328-PA protein Name:"Similar to FUT1 Galactoside 2-alpha-L-fucosyltransferase 1 (Homo sapiens)" AED:0.00 eAED:0.00 QI:26/1/1/1/0.66/0.85/7/57/438
MKGVKLLVLLPLTLASNESQSHSECRKQESQLTDQQSTCDRTCVPFDPHAPSVVIRDTQGRLGNQMFAYLLLLSLKLQFGYQPYLTRKGFDHLSPYFENLDMEVAEDVLCDFDDVYPKFRLMIKEKRLEMIKQAILDKLGYHIELERDDQGRWKLPPEIMNNPDLNPGEIVHDQTFRNMDAIDIEKSAYPWEVITKTLSIVEFANSTYHYGRAFILYPENYSASREESRFINEGPGVEEALVRAFRLKQHYIDSAQEELNKILNEHEGKKAKKKSKKSKSKKKKKKDAPIFVGIHSRRTDHQDFESVTGFKTLKPSYYLHAMEMYREHFKNVIFIYISDDLQWGKTHLRPRTKAGDLYFGGQGSPHESHSIGFDLALMSLCNHTILSYGTFSYWVGFMAGGSVILPKHFPDYRTGSDAKAFYHHPLKNPFPRLHPYLL